MNSNSIEIYSSYNKNKTSSPCDLSPVTTLTLNLSGLSTSVAGTPFRRASWSNPVTKGGMICNDFSCAESPTFREIFPRKNKAKHRVRKCISKILPSDSEDDKENIAPLVHCQKSPVHKSDENIQCRSQDSGYSGASEKFSLDSPLSPLFSKDKNFFTDDEEDDFENIFHLEEMDEVDKLSPVPTCMSNLLAKPILEPHKSPNRLHGSRFGKLPIRRCLSMEMDSESDSSESTPKEETYLASSSAKSFLHKVKNTTNIFKRPEPPNDYLTSYNKRRKSSASITSPDAEDSKDNFILKRSYSETAATIMHALLKADLQPELIGDGSRSYALPLCKGRHQDLKSITPETLVGLLKGDFQLSIENFTIVDCRYPYEFEGGHIQGAKNIYTKEDLVSTFLEDNIDGDQRNAIVFHCEFSSERAPTLCRFLRKKDREVNEGQYPRLHHPEVYVLEGGYKAFFETFKEFCVPQNYTPMNHKDHGFELRHFRAKSKSWGTDCKGRAKLRSSSKSNLI